MPVNPPRIANAEFTYLAISAMQGRYKVPSDVVGFNRFSELLDLETILLKVEGQEAGELPEAGSAGYSPMSN